MAAAAQPSPDFRAIFDMAMPWSATEDPDTPWRSQLNGHNLAVRMNDFPEQPLYSLLVDGQVAADFDDWPSTWTRAS